MQILLSLLAYLVEEQLPPLLLPQVHPLDGHLPARVVGAPPVRGDAHYPGRALPDLDEILQLVAGIPGGHHHLWEGRSRFASADIILNYHGSLIYLKDFLVRLSCGTIFSAERQNCKSL